MGKFINDLDSYIQLVETEEIFQSHNEYMRRTHKEMCLQLALSTGTIAATAYYTFHTNQSEVLVAGIASVALINSLFGLYRNRRLKTLWIYCFYFVNNC